MAYTEALELKLWKNMSMEARLSAARQLLADLKRLYSELAPGQKGMVQSTLREATCER
jgi:hypothetical protein